jgi:hypothetical protein
MMTNFQTIQNFAFKSGMQSVLRNLTGFLLQSTVKVFPPVESLKSQLLQQITFNKLAENHAHADPAVWHEYLFMR